MTRDQVASRLLGCELDDVPMRCWTGAGGVANRDQPMDARRTP